MNILIGSKNVSKERSIKLALNELGYTCVNTKMIEVNSLVSSKPLNEETLIGVQNRNANLYNYAISNNISFDYLISIEGGYEKVGDAYFIVTYASVRDINGGEYFGKSMGLQITKNMYEWVKAGKSLNSLIEKIELNQYNKKENGITGYLTSGLYKRDIVDKEAVISAFKVMENYNTKYKALEKLIHFK